jgi:DNA-binding NtrC family response regulator
MPDKQGTILIVDDTPTNIGVLLDYLNTHDFRVLVAREGESAIEQACYARPDLILLDVMMPGIDGFETCRRLKQDPATQDIPVIFMSALSDTVDKVRGFSVGGVDYVTKPFQQEEVYARITTHLTLRRLQVDLMRSTQELEATNRELEQRVVARTAELSKANGSLQAALAEVEQLKNQLQAENIYLREELQLEHNFEEIVGRSTALQRVLRQVEQVATTDATVLLLGETGTGKELFARALHHLGPRKSRPLVKVNCGALPSNLIESELFGHEKGAFTGAIARSTGRFELADKGTLFLDEIGDLPLELQSKLLRVLQEGEFERLGNPRTLRVDVRIIAATNRDLRKAVQEGKFREDLYYRLNVFPITVPPLRERPDDIPLLARHFVARFARRMGKPLDTIPQRTMAALQQYAWPGNIRELENIIERAVILSPGNTLQLDDLLDGTTAAPRTCLQTLEEVERDYIQRTLDQTQWRIEGPRGAAARLGLNPSTLRSRIQKLGIEKP